MNARRFGLVGWGVAAVLAASWGALWVGGMRLNTSASIPTGLWRERPMSRPVQRGDLVAICPEASRIFNLAKSRGYLENGWCAGRLEVMFKPVAAVAGDVVVVNSTGITVNGLPIAHSAALPTDSERRPLPAQPPGVYVVGPAEVWLISDWNEHSFDSRYFGAIATRHIRGLLKPWALDRPHGSRVDGESSSS
jgi:conjugative transfer signal peptidase TraF